MAENLRLFVYVIGDTSSFSVTIERSKTVDELKKAILMEISDVVKDVAAHRLTLYKVDIDLKSHCEGSLSRLDVADGEKLPAWDLVSEHWPDQPAPKRLHVLVKLPDTTAPSRLTSAQSEDEHRSKRPRVQVEPPFTPPRQVKAGMVENTSPPRLNQANTETVMENAIEKFGEYIDYLAKGKLDGYLDSVGSEGKDTDLNMDLPVEPTLLLHGLGGDLSQEDEGRIKELFLSGSTQLFAVSGSGKTRLALEGLCRHWGMYFSCSTNIGSWASGSGDVQEATRAMTSMTAVKSLNESPSSTQKNDNIDATHRAFAQLLCARIFILKKLLQKIPSGTAAAIARRRWVFLQISPPHIGVNDIFVTVLRAIRGGVTEILMNIVSNTLDLLVDTKPDLFPCARGLFAVVDEAQVAANNLKPYFLSTDGASQRPILREIVKFLNTSNMFKGLILSGTGLSLSMVEEALVSSSAKRGVEKRVFIHTGCFNKENSSHTTYINRYLRLSDNASDKRLLQRMQYWLSGRYRPTASFIELLLSEENIPRHRAFTHFVHCLTGFTITDATDLEEKEPPIPYTLAGKMQAYHPISSAHLLFERNNAVDLIQELRRVVMRWTIGSEATFLTEDQMYESIALGVGFLDDKTRGRKFNNSSEYSAKYPVYISEPLVVLDLRRTFEKHRGTTRKGWLASAVCDARNRPTLGFVFEEVVLFILVEIFGGKGMKLSEAFKCDQPWASREVKLVSLQSTLDGDLRTCDVSWSYGSSDRFGFKAKSPKDVLLFLSNPDGKAFIFPDVHMGPDLLCFLQDVETKELIIVAVQAKPVQKLDTSTWLSALSSVNPDHFYTVRSKEDGELHQYAPTSYPTLRDDVAYAFEMILGQEEFTPTVQDYCQKLRSFTKATRQSPLATRKTPRFLRVIATHHDDQSHRLKAESPGDVVVLRWNSVEEYSSSVAAACSGSRHMSMPSSAE